MKNKGLAFKLILLILSRVTLIFLVIFGYNYMYSRKIIIENVEKNAINLARATVNQIDVVLSSVEKIPKIWPMSLISRSVPARSSTIF